MCLRLLGDERVGERKGGMKGKMMRRKERCCWHGTSMCTKVGKDGRTTLLKGRDLRRLLVICAHCEDLCFLLLLLSFFLALFVYKKKERINLCSPRNYLASMGVSAVKLNKQIYSHVALYFDFTTI